MTVLRSTNYHKRKLIETFAESTQDFANLICVASKWQCAIKVIMFFVLLSQKSKNIVSAI